MPESEPHFDPSLGIYNPGTLAPEVLLEEFIARRQKLAKALEIVRDSQLGHTPQHLLVLGPRGIGKTMFLLALAYSIEGDPELNREWITVVFPEETYAIGDLADFWLFASTVLADKIENEQALNEIEQLRASNPSDIEEQAHQLFLKHLASTGKRAFLVIENLHEFFASVTDQDEQHRLRAFLMQSDQLLFAASTPSYFKASGNVDLPFYDFFRTFRLERFSRDEMLEVLHNLAKIRKDDHVIEVLKKQPERIDSLRILTGGNPRLIKMIYRLLQEGGTGTARQDLDRLLEDCTPYFKHRIEDLKTEERRVFDHVARHWDPVAVGDIQTALRRKSNQISTYLNRLIDKGFIEEAEGSTPKRKSYQVAERFYNIYYLMRYSRSGKQRLAWLVQAMKVLYSENDFRKWTKETLTAWKDSTDPRQREDRVAFLHSLTYAAETSGLRNELIHEALDTAWEEDRLQCLSKLIDGPLAQETLGPTFDVINFFSTLPSNVKQQLGYKPQNAQWWKNLAWTLRLLGKTEFFLHAMQKATELDSLNPESWNHLATIYGISGDFWITKEIDSYKQAIYLEPKNAKFILNLAKALARKKQSSQQAEKHFKAAIDLSPSPESWLDYANFLREQKTRTDDAEDVYHRAIDLKPAYAEAWRDLAVFLFLDLGKSDEAEEAFVKTLELNPDDPFSMWSYAHFSSHVRNNRKKSLDILLRLVSKFPRYGLGHISLADEYEKQHKIGQAEKHIGLGISLNPELELSRILFTSICGENRKAWTAALPHLLQQLSKKNEPRLQEFIQHGLTFLLSGEGFPSFEAINLILEHNAQEPLSEILLALQSLEDPALLTKASPERQAFAKDFLAKVGLGQEE